MSSTTEGARRTSIIRTTHSARYSYPGVFLPEQTSRTLSGPTLVAAIAAAPTADDGWFRQDGWYAVEISTTKHRRFVDADTDDEVWVKTLTELHGRWVVGERFHYEDLEREFQSAPEKSDIDRILISNIKSNSKDGYGVRTRCGNWQIASDYTGVLAPAAVERNPVRSM